MMAEKVSKAEILALLTRLVEDAESFESCVGCAGEPEYDEETNEEEIVHEDDCTIVKAKALIERLEKELLP